MQQGELDDAVTGTTDFRCVVEAIPHVVWVARADGHTEFFNRRGVEYTGTTQEATSGLGWLRLVHPDDRRRSRAAWMRAVETATPLETEYRVRDADGRYRWMASRAVPMFDAAGEVVRWVGTWTDVEELRRSRDELCGAMREQQRSVALLDALQSTAPLGFGFVDCDYRLQHINPTLAELNGLDPDTCLGRTVEELVPGEWPRLEGVYRSVMETGKAVLDEEVTRKTPSGETRHWLACYYPVRFEGRCDGVGFAGIDVTERRRGQVLRETVMNSLTEGVVALDAAGRVTLMNAAAEQMLGWSFEELRGRHIHSIVHFQRADGTPLPEEECELLRVRVHGETVRVVEDVFTRKDGSILPVSLSAGPLPAVGEVDGVVDAHGVAVVFRDATGEQTEKARARRELATLSWSGQIRDALDEGRFVLYGQRIMPLRDGRPSVELLLRMVSRDRTIIAPRSFLPVAERCGLIGEIDRWVIREAARLAARGMRVEANLSAISMTQLDLVPDIEQAIRRAGAKPGDIVFEITETAFMQDMEVGASFARRLDRLGCGLALDDFGTGFATFTYLKRLPVDYLKIDVDFVRDLPSNQANQHLVKAVVSLARSFGLETIAEGVGDTESLALLQELGVDFAQGYFLGCPEPIEVP